MTAFAADANVAAGWFERHGGGMFPQRRARAIGRHRQPPGIIERIEMPAAEVEPRPGIDCSTEFFHGFLGIQHACAVITIVAGQMRRVLSEMRKRFFVMRGDDEAVFERTIDAVPFDERAHQRLGFFREAPQIARVHGPEPFFQRGLLHAQTRVNLSAIASGGAEAGGLGLQQHRLNSGLGQMKRGRKARIAAADHTDFGFHRTGQTGKGRRRTRACRIIALWKGCRHPPSLGRVPLRVAPCLAVKPELRGRGGAHTLMA